MFFVVNNSTGSNVAAETMKLQNFLTEEKLYLMIKTMQKPRLVDQIF